jgi:integrase
LFQGHGFQGWSPAKRALDARSGVQGWVLHDLRRSTASHLGDLGVAPHTIEHLLGHQYGSRVSRTYNRSAYERDVKIALAQWADRLQTLVDGSEQRIIPLRSREELA